MQKGTIHITLRRAQSKKVLIKEYTKTLGISHSPIYRVPSYVMNVKSSAREDNFAVVRAGPIRKPSATVQNRECRYGIFKNHRVQTAASWRNTYTPRTLAEHSILGALQLWPGKGYLIHEGPPTFDFAMGTAGCIEVIGRDNWQKFVDRVKPWALRGKVTFSAESIEHPEAELAIKQPSIVDIWAKALYRNWLNRTPQNLELTVADVDDIIAAASRSLGGITFNEAKELFLIGNNYNMPDEARLRIWNLLQARLRRQSANPRKTGPAVGTYEP